MVHVYTLDGFEHLAALHQFFDGHDGWHLFLQEIEKRLGVPIENQVFYADNKKWLPIKCYPMPKKIHLGFQPTMETDDEKKLELYRNINGYYDEVRILNKFGGQELLEAFDSNPQSTYYDLKLYIESNLKIPVDLQVALRRDWTTEHYWEPKNDEFLINYMLNDDLKVSDHNIVYLMIEQSTRYVSDNDGITKIKPISIYSQHESDEMTIIITILPEEHLLTLSDVKSKVEKQFGLPSEYQLIYKGLPKHIENIYNAEKSLLTLIHYYDSVENKLDLYLTADCCGNQRNLQICRENGIKMLEIQIVTPSGRLVAECQPTLRFTSFSSIKSVVEEKHKLSIRNQIFYDTNFTVLNSRETVWGHFGSDILNRNCRISILMKKAKSNDDYKICERLEIPQVSPEIVIRPLAGNKEICKVDLDKITNLDESWLLPLTRHIRDKLQLPCEPLLCLDGEIIHENQTMTFTDWKNLYFCNGIVREEIVFNLTFEPTMNAQVEEFCENHNIPTLKTLKVKFLSSEMDVDLRMEPTKCVLEVITYISNKKNIPICALEIFFKGEILLDHENLMELFIKEFTSPNYLEFHVVVKPMNDLSIHLKSPYETLLNLPVDHIIMSGSQKFYNVKEEIANLTGIPICQLNITCSQAVSNESFIQDLVRNRDSGKIDVTIWKTVTVKIVDKYDSIKTQKYDIKDDYETIHALLLAFDKRLKLHKKRKISRKTLLCDLGSEDIIELTEKEHDSCKLM